MATSIEIQQQFTKLVELRNTFIEQQNKLLKEQSALYSQIVEKIEKMGGKNDFGNNVSRWNKTFLDFNKTTEKGTDKLKDSMDEVKEKTDLNNMFFEKMGDNFDKLNKKSKGFSLLGTVFKGLGNGVLGVAKSFAGVLAVASSTITFATKATKAILRFATSVISFPFKILNGIINMAGAMQSSTELAEAIEAVRKEFGYLDRTAGGTILSLSHSLKGNLAQTGLSVMRVLGNTAAVIRYFTEYAHNLGEVLDAVGTNIGEGGAGALVAYNKALGLTAAGQKAIAARSVATGQSINSINQEIANYSIQLSDAFGVTMKAVSRAVGEMMADVSHFGHLAPKELVQVSVYARKLGIDVKNLGQVMDKFMNFEDTATAASNLSQAFGLNIDAFKLMQEQDPAKKMEMLRKAFFAAGKSIETMTYQERRLLAQQTGLDDAALQTTFSLKNQSMSYDQIQKKGDAAKKKQLTQAEAMEKLAGAIERLVRSGQAGSGGFFERFVQGFQTGIMWSADFRRMIRNIRTDLFLTYRTGIQMGREFVRAFPGVRDLMGGIADLFNPQRFRTLLGGVSTAFVKFFDNLNAEQLLHTLSESFRNWISGSGGGFKRILTGARAFATAFGSILSQGLRLIIPALTNGLRELTTFIVEGPSRNLREQSSTLSGSILGFFVNAFNEIKNDARLRQALEDLSSAALKFLAASWEKLRPIITPLLERAGRAMFTYALGRVAASVGAEIMKTLAKEVGLSLIRSIASAFTGSGMTAITSSLTPALNGIAGAFSGISASAVALGVAITGVVALFAGFLTYPQRTQSVVDKLSDKIKDFSSNIGKYIGMGLGYIIKGIAWVVAKIGDLVGIIGQKIRDKFSELGKDSRGFFGAIIGNFTGFLGRILDAGASTVRAIVGMVGSLIMGLVEGIATGLKSVFPEAAGTIDAVVNAIREVGHNISIFVTAATELIKDVFKGIISFGGSAITTIINTITSVGNTVSSVFGGIYTTIRDIFTRIKDTVFGDIQALVGRFTAIGDTLTAPFRALMSLVRANHSHSVNTIVGADMNRTVAVVQSAGEQMTTAMDNSFKQMTAASSEASTKMAEKGPASGIDTASLSTASSALSQAKMLAEAMSVVHAQYSSIQEVSDEKLASLGMFLEKVGSMSSRLQEIHSERIVEVASKLVKDVNQVSADLRSIEPISLETSLKRLANNLGLQELKELSIPQRRINLQITLNVTMDAEDVETVLVERPDSRILVRE
jgi:hypothetical protein